MRRLLAGLAKPGDLTTDAAATMAADDGQGFVDRITETGFTGGINWYRNFDRNWELTPQLDGAKVEVPSFFVGGADDPVLTMSPPDNQETWLTDHRGSVIIDGAGHWVQQEAPELVNAALLDFCDQLREGNTR